MHYCDPAGVEFDELPGPEQQAALANMAVFARVEPSHKQRLVEQLKAQVCTAKRVCGKWCVHTGATCQACTANHDFVQ